MAHTHILLSIVFIPVIGAFLMPLIGRFSQKMRNACALGCVAASLIGAIALMRPVIGGQVISFILDLPLGFNFILRADILAVFMAIASALVGAIIVFYSFGYINHYENRNEYYFMVVLFLGSMMGLVFSGNLIFLYIFWEMTAIASWRLIGFFREKQYVERADKAFLVTVSGALLMLLGFLMLYQKTGSFDLDIMKRVLGGTELPPLAVALILCGILTKSATLPFHTWLPDAGVAPSPVTALLHAAVLVKIGVYVFARLFVATFPLGALWHMIIPAIAAASALVSAGAALIATDMKRIIAYSTVSQIAFILLGFGIGTEVAVAGGLLYILMHGLAKGGLFLCAGIVEQNTRTKDITKMGGLIATMPVTAISFLVCSFSVMGIPPFGGFFSKYLVFAGTMSAGHYYLGCVFLVGAFLTILYLARIFSMVFLGDLRIANSREGSATMVVSVAALAALSLACGLFIAFPSGFAQAAVKQMFGS